MKKCLQKMGLIHKHRWVVQYNDDDACTCGKWRNFVSGEIYTPGVSH